MTICPKCNADNRPEAAFCSNCGTILLAQTVTLKPVQPQPTPTEPITTPSAEPETTPVELPAQILPINEMPTPESVTLSIAEEQVQLTGLAIRKEGTIFGDQYLYESLVDQVEHEISYTVTEACQPPAPCVSICTNPECRTIHVPTGNEQEKFCTQCGQALTQPPLLLLEESDIDQYGKLKPLIDLHLAHPNVHPPISVFNDAFSGGVRYYLVTPYSQEVPASPEISEVLQWGLQLASGLDYLHSNGIVFGEELAPSNIGYMEGKLVWRKFSNVRILPMLADREKINDVRLLAICLYSWITGRTTFIADHVLTPNLNRLFYQALVGEGFTSGMELAQQIELAISAGISPFNLDYHIGQRTHPGKERSANEDSMLCLSLSSVQMGASQPAGIFAIADGMGGHATGDLASSLAIQSFTEEAVLALKSLQNRNSVENVAWLRQAVQAANQSVYNSRLQEDNDMGTTLVCGVLFNNKAYFANLGDSRVYLVREGSIQQLTTDHSMVQQMVTIGQITPEEARTHPQRNVIYRSLGEKQVVDADIFSQDLLPGDKLLFCSDGLNGMLDDQKIKILIQESASPQVACDYLIDAANLAGGEDNISVILVEVILA
jgi:protein phosphatase